MQPKSTAISSSRLHFATSRFIMEMRRQQLAQNPNALPSVKDLESYNDSHKSALLKAIRIAILAASPEADASYERWMNEKNQEN
ncbi:hypothetical protein FHV99_004599 [Ochrobactrum sp. P20RRXII]|nr:hypothetical protein [Ochrobactrum sp. P20RRXII]